MIALPCRAHTLTLLKLATRRAPDDEEANAVAGIPTGKHKSEARLRGTNEAVEFQYQYQYRRREFS